MSDMRELQYLIEGITLRRICEKRIEGYTIEMAKEISDAVADEIASLRAQLASARKALVDWTYLYATEGGAWPDDKTVTEPLISLSARAPTQADAVRLQAGATLKQLLSLTDEKST